MRSLVGLLINVHLKGASVFQPFVKFIHFFMGSYSCVKWLREVCNLCTLTPLNLHRLHLFQLFGLVIVEKSGYFLSALHHPMLFHIQPVIPFLKSHHITHQRSEWIKFWRHSLFLIGERSQPWNQCTSEGKFSHTLPGTNILFFWHLDTVPEMQFFCSVVDFRRRQAGVRQSLLHCYRSATM